ncbi:nuclease-related domain-containing DEAD/DEAH box helicase [Modestobacter sp. VKM Ac-2978]|uniref:nuclease-related domain-containing DEAD/DEAH box helicase n=1 Tax=Modestobacter sp. VKM Ac-2978 TaxID=3004132 RepID=UPI0022AA28D0|nr:NERD domain-containing protein [Modestobacter sp. VKM Ac-2978]MCZ2849136.1 NERD domain-containing protein [Modestobacter sp. VKM Ac-2978]
MKLIPSLAQLGQIESRGEFRVAELIAQMVPSRPATCLYSVHLPRHEYKRMSEIDFLIVYDDLVLVVEVKGGRLSRRAGAWTFTDRYGETSEKREGPFEQARTGMHALRDGLRKRLPALDVAFGYLVVTPDQELGRDLEWDPQVLAGPRAMSVTALERALEEARSYWLDKELRRPVGNAYRDLLSVLRPDFDRVPSMASRVASLENEYVRFADRQYELLLVAERNRRIVCLGGAGSGKTLLAVETARRAALVGDRVLLTCRSKALASVLRQALSGSGVTCLPFESTADAEPADVLIVDEAQDLMDLQSYAQLDALILGGWEKGRWRLFCDTNNQANIDGTFDRSVFEELAATATVVELPFNCRNTATIVHQTQMVTGADIGVARAGQGPPVEYKQCPDDDATARLLDAHLKHLRQAEVDDEDIVVVTIRDVIADSAARESKAFRTGRLTPVLDPAAETAGKIRLTTATQIKGLEAAHVCVVDVEDVVDLHARARLYVAMTRARISLWIGLSPTAWSQIASGSQTGAQA